MTPPTMNHMALVDSRDVTHQLQHTRSHTHAYARIQTAKHCHVAFGILEGETVCEGVWGLWQGWGVDV